MSDHEQEQEIAMALAQRAYLYSLLHVVFGGELAGESARAVFSEATAEALSAQRAGATDAEEEAAFAAAIACVEDHAADAGDDAFIEGLKGDYTRLFLVPGKAYVHPWESPYIGDGNMVFQESTLDVRSYYHAEGFKLQAERKFPDDHIAAMMDFMGRLSTRAYDEFADGRDEDAARTLATQARFADAHLLAWLPQFADEASARDAHGVYAAFARALEEHMLDEVIDAGSAVGQKGKHDGKGDGMQLRRRKGDE